jgi:hypothetical protein
MASPVSSNDATPRRDDAPAPAAAAAPDANAASPASASTSGPRAASGARAPGATRLAAALLVAPVVVGGAALAAPHLPEPPGGGFAEFVLAAGTAIGALAVAATAEVPLAASIATGAAAAAALIALSFVPFSMTGVVIVATALVALGWAIGAAIGRRVQHPGHLLPACIVAACADIASVVSPHGPTHAIVSSERALSLLAVSFPVLGTTDAAPALGAGDLVFAALLLGAARVHALPYVRTALLVLAGAIAAALLSAALEAAVPALPTIGAAVLLGVPRVRRLERRDRMPAQVFMVLAATAAALTVASKMGWLPGSPPPE